MCVCVGGRGGGGAAVSTPECHILPLFHAHTLVNNFGGDMPKKHIFKMDCTNTYLFNWRSFGREHNMAGSSYMSTVFYQIF